MKLLKNGIDQAEIVYGDHPSPTDETMVAELCFCLRMASKRDWRAVPRPSSFSGGRIYVGHGNPYARKAGFKVPFGSFQEDTCYFEIRKNDMVLDGGERGKIYAVYEFAERFLDQRFYEPGDMEAPLFQNLELPPIKFEYTPPIRFRELYNWKVRWNPLWAERLRMNIETVKFGYASHGGSLVWAYPRSHTAFEKLMPPEDPKTGFISHPEYYSYSEEKKKRVGRHHEEFGFPWGEGDLDWSNDEMLRVLTERLKQWILDSPDATIFSVTQTDWGPHCSCEKCYETAMRYSSDGEPRWSALIVVAINKIAREIKRWQASNPRVKGRTIYLQIFAYNDTFLPPVGLSLEDNVVVQFCTNQGCFYHPFDDQGCFVNRVFRDALEGWRKMTHNLYFWDYYGNQTMGPAFSTTFTNFQRNVRYLSQGGCFALFEEQFGNEEAVPFYAVETYLSAMLLWNPDLPLEEEKDRAYRHFYGEAGSDMQKVKECWLKHLQEIPDLHFGASPLVIAPYYPASFLEEADVLYRHALSLPLNEKREEAVKREYAIFRFLRMYLHKGENMVELDDTIRLFQHYGMKFEKWDAFVAHFHGGRQDDLFKPEIEERNYRREQEHWKELKRKAETLRREKKK